MDIKGPSKKYKYNKVLSSTFHTLIYIYRLIDQGLMFFLCDNITEQ